MNSGGHAPLASPILRRPCWRLPGMIACSDKEESTHPVLLSRDGQVPALPIPAGAHCFYHYVVNKGVQMYSLHSSLWRYISQSWRCCALFFCRLKYARTQLTHTNDDFVNWDEWVFWRRFLTFSFILGRQFELVVASFCDRQTRRLPWFVYTTQ